MNFVKGKGKLKKFKRLGACFSWLFITFIFGFLVSYLFLEYKGKLNDSQNLWVVLASPLTIGSGLCFYILTLISNCGIKGIKGIKIKDFEAASSKTDDNNNYKIFCYGIEPYVRNKLGIKHGPDLRAKIQDSEKYHKCELMVYETLANRRFWNIFCPFIGTEVLTMEEINDIVGYSIIQPNIQLTIQLNTQLNK